MIYGTVVQNPDNRNSIHPIRLRDFWLRKNKSTYSFLYCTVLYLFLYLYSQFEWNWIRRSGHSILYKLVCGWLGMNGVLCAIDLRLLLLCALWWFRSHHAPCSLSIAYKKITLLITVTHAKEFDYRSSLYSTILEIVMMIIYLSRTSNFDTTSYYHCFFVVLVTRRVPSVAHT